jgi:hypothetical protein
MRASRFAFHLVLPKVVFCCALLLNGVILAGQSPSTGSSPKGHEHYGATKGPRADQSPQPLSEGTDVMSVQYRCAPSQASGAPKPCVISVSKAEFDALVSALDPNMPESSRISLASEYARLLIMAAAAQQRGIDQTEDFKTLVKYATLQLLSTRLVRDINGHPNKVVSEADIDRYLSDHEGDYQQVTFDKVVLPKNSGIAGKSISAEAYANELHRRAVNGESFTKLQAEVTGLSAQDAAGHGRVGPISCLSLLESQRQVCRMKPGEISPVLQDQTGFSILKLVALQAVLRDQAKAQVRELLKRQALQTEIESVRTPVALNLDERYFGKLPSADVAHKHGMHTPSATVTDPSKAAESHQHPE